MTNSEGRMIELSVEGLAEELRRWGIAPALKYKPDGSIYLHLSGADGQTGEMRVYNAVSELM